MIFDFSAHKLPPTSLPFDPKKAALSWGSEASHSSTWWPWLQDMFAYYEAGWREICTWWSDTIWYFAPPFEKRGCRRKTMSAPPIIRMTDTTHAPHPLFDRILDVWGLLAWIEGTWMRQDGWRLQTESAYIDVVASFRNMTSLIHFFWHHKTQNQSLLYLTHLVGSAMVFLTIHSVFCVINRAERFMVVRRIRVMTRSGCSSVPGTVNTAFFDLLKKYIVLMRWICAWWWVYR